MTTGLRHRILRWTRDEDGAALVEFALLLPLILVVFAVIIEGSRLFWSYQATIAGVRDATRYITRAVQTDICDGGQSLDSWSSRLETIVKEASDGTELFPSSISIVSVEATLDCVEGGYRLVRTPITTVTAVLDIEFPFKSTFEWVGLTLPDRTTVVTDSGRIFGA